MGDDRFYFTKKKSDFLNSPSAKGHSETSISSYDSVFLLISYLSS